MVVLEKKYLIKRNFMQSLKRIIKKSITLSTCYVDVYGLVYGLFLVFDVPTRNCSNNAFIMFCRTRCVSKLCAY